MSIPVPTPLQKLGSASWQFFTTIARVVQGTSVSDVSTADASNPGATYSQTEAQETVNVANDTKAQLNALLASLRASGVIKE